MEKKYDQTIKIGIIGGVAVTILDHVFATLFLSNIIPHYIWIIYIQILIPVLTAAITGVLAVHYARHSLNLVKDAAKTANIAGLVAGLINGIVYSIENAIYDPKISSIILGILIFIILDTITIMLCSGVGGTLYAHLILGIRKNPKKANIQGFEKNPRS